MWDDLLAGQAAIVAGILLLAAAAKAADRFLARGDASLTPTVLSSWLGAERARHAEVGVAASEALIGAWLLSGMLAGIAGATAAAFLFAATGVLILTHSRNPQAGCGCFGARSSTPIDTRSILRPALLGVVALGPAISGGEVWIGAFHRPVVLIILLFEVALTVGASRELRFGQDPPAEWAEDRDLRRAVRAVRRSRTFRRLQDRLRSPVPSDAWIDPEHPQRVVLFELGANRPGAERYIAFAVSSTRRAKITSVGEMKLTATAEGWQATHSSVS